MKFLGRNVEHPFAVIYPTSSVFASRILDERKSVFVKYTTSEKLTLRLLECKKIIIYESNTGRKVTGECDISSICMMEPSQVISENGKYLFLSEDELRSYSHGRENKKLTVFKLNKIKKYSIPIILDHQITIGGEYISKDEYEQLIQKS